MPTSSRLRKLLASLPGARPLVHAARRGGAWMREHGRPGGAQARARRVAAFWDAQPAPLQMAVEGPRDWLASPYVLNEYVFSYFGGQDFFTYFRARYASPPRRRALSLCCGKGELERALHGSGACNTYDGLDISPEAIEICRREAAALGDGTYSYQVADLEHLSLPEDHYDLILGWSALHHLRNLSPLFAQVRRSLQPHGVFLVNEYVGPSRFRISKVQLDLINQSLSLLPRELRRLSTGGYRDIYIPATPEQVAAADPSEAICSHRILPLLYRHFTILERIDYGGTVLQWALQDIIGNFSPEVPEHAAYLHQFFDLERDALRRGVIKSNFVFVVAGKG